MDIAQKRARTRFLRNIIWIRSWVEGINYLGLLPFNHLHSSGVLHHLKKPSLALNILKECLRANGGVTLMVYGHYGRTGVYQTQALLKSINLINDIVKELLHAELVLNILPSQNWFTRNHLIHDHKSGHSGIYDLLLHKRDVAFSVTSMIEWIQNSGLSFVDFRNTITRMNIHAMYDIATSDLKSVFSKHCHVKRSSIVEIFKGIFYKHDVYASRMEKSIADIQDKSNVWYLYGNPYGINAVVSNKMNYILHENRTVLRARLYDTYETQSHLSLLSRSDIKRYNVSNGISFAHFGCDMNKFNMFIVDKLIHYKKRLNLAEIYNSYRKWSKTNISKNVISKRMRHFYESVKDTGMFLLREKKLDSFPKTRQTRFFVLIDN